MKSASHKVCLEALQKMGTADTSHSGRTLLNHLEGTYKLLRKWGNREEVCRGGLFHSIYGTQFFRTQTADLSERKEIRALIGFEAEELAYLFCLADRKKLILWNFERLNKFVWVNRLTSQEEIITEQVLRGLVEIEFANDLEQFNPNEQIAEDEKIWRTGFFSKGRRWASPPAWEDFALSLIPMY
jgi:hypothetical protein